MTDRVCSCCGQPVGVNSLIIGLKMSRRVESMALALSLRMGEWVAFPELIDAVWASHPPADPKLLIRNYSWHLREYLAGTNLILETRYGQRRLRWREPIVERIAA